MIANAILLTCSFISVTFIRSSLTAPTYKQEEKKIRESLAAVESTNREECLIDWLAEERSDHAKDCQRANRLEQNLTDAYKDIGFLRAENNKTGQELKRIKAPLSVRERIEYLENMISPAYMQTKQFTSTKEEVGFHEARWIYILTKQTDDPMVKKMLQFINDNAYRGMTIEIFARRVAGFFHFRSNKIHVPALETYTTAELKLELKEFFGSSFDNFTFDIVCSLKDFNEDPTTTLESTISNLTILP